MEHFDEHEFDHEIHKTYEKHEKGFYILDCKKPFVCFVNFVCFVFFFFLMTFAIETIYKNSRINS